MVAVARNTFLQRKWCSMALHHVRSYAGREHLEGRLTLLDEIVTDVLCGRSGGGRFHISDAGAFLAEDGWQVTSFVLR